MPKFGFATQNSADCTDVRSNPISARPIPAKIRAINPPVLTLESKTKPHETGNYMGTSEFGPGSTKYRAISTTFCVRPHLGNIRDNLICFCKLRADFGQNWAVLDQCWLVSTKFRLVSTKHGRYDHVKLISAAEFSLISANFGLC